MTPNQTPKDVLLADDDKEDIEVFQSALKATSVPTTLRVAHDGDELFVELNDTVPNILFLDIDMPCKDGLSCIIEIRKNKRYDRMPVVMFTSHTAKSLIETAYRTGANQYMVKVPSLIKMTKQLNYLLSINWEKNIYYPPREEFVLD